MARRVLLSVDLARGVIKHYFGQIITSEMGARKAVDTVALHDGSQLQVTTTFGMFVWSRVRPISYMNLRFLSKKPSNRGLVARRWMRLLVSIISLLSS